MTHNLVTSSLWKKTLACAVPFLALSIASIAAAEEEMETSTAEIEEVFVEGKAMSAEISEIALDLSEFGTQVQVITSEEVVTGGFTNFGELAAGLIRGANIGYSPDEGEFTIRLDGGYNRDTLLLLDGVPTYDRGTPLESLWPATMIDPRMIESVEVMRGGQSLYFGGNAGAGVVNVKYKEPDGTVKGDIGFYVGSFKTREAYGNISFPITPDGKHSGMAFARSYETDAHELFDKDEYVDTVLALGGHHEFPYSYNLIGAKYLWQIDETTEFRATAQYATVDFRDSFPWLTVYQPNFTEFPYYDISFEKEFSDRLYFTAEAYYIEPQIHNIEFDVQTCNIPRMQDLPQNVQDIAAAQGIPAFSDATAYETFADSVDGLARGCVLNPYHNNRSLAAVGSNNSYYTDESNVPYGTQDNPFPIGAPIGYVIQSIASNGSRQPTKGLGEPTQFYAGYTDYGFNTRARYRINDTFTVVGGIQNTTYKDNSDEEYGVAQDKVATTGAYVDLRLSFPQLLDGLNGSVAFRHDKNEMFADYDMVKYGFRWDLGRGVYARASGGNSYSPPTTREVGLYSVTSNSGGVGQTTATLNPDVETQQFQGVYYGAGINGEIFGGTYNVEVGAFDNTISHVIRSDAIEDVCPNYAVAPEDLNPDIITPTAFCNSAEKLGLPGTATSFFNLRDERDITGTSLDIAYDSNFFQVDFSYTQVESTEPNPYYGKMAIREGTGETLDFVIPGWIGKSERRQGWERPEWMASLLLSYTPSERWVFALNPRFQGPEWGYGRGRMNYLVDENDQVIYPPEDWGSYTIWNGSVQYYLGENLEHRFQLRFVNIFDETAYERQSSADQRHSTAAVRREIGQYDAEYYYYYHWNTKPRSVWLQYSYNF